MNQWFAAIRADLDKIESAYKALARVYEDLASCFICIEHGRTAAEHGACVHCGRTCMQFEDGHVVVPIHEEYDAVLQERFELAAQRDIALDQVEYLRKVLGRREPIKAEFDPTGVPDYEHIDDSSLKKAYRKALEELAELKQLDAKRGEAARALLDALSMPHGRNVRGAWAKACLLYGRYDKELSLGAFVSYWEDLKPGAFFDYLMKAAQEMGAKTTSE